jgi:hypothetical protein
MFHRVRKLLVSSGLVLAGLGVGGPASAVLVVGNFDPSFGGLGFNGTATFTISQSCLSFTGFIWANFNCSTNSAGGLGAAGMSFQGATVNFTQNGNPAGAVSFAANPIGILGMYVQGGTVVGVQSILFGPSTPDTSLPGNPTFNLFFGVPGQTLLALIGEGQPPGPPDEGPSSGDLDDLPASSFRNPTLGVNNCTQAPCSATATNTTYTLPEPESLALVMAGLGAAGLAGTRRRRTPAA